MGNCLSFGPQRDPNEEEALSLKQFHLLRSVGRGAFGKVRIVQKKDTKKMYALKYIHKEKCVRMRAVHNILAERRLLEEIQNPFIVNLHFAFQDSECLFMVIDLMLGGDLRYRLDRTGPLGEPCVRFYVAEIGIALEYLYKRSIIHRDIKPDNLLLDSDGHVHVTDFNVATRIRAGRLVTAAAGTRAYMAPEIFAQKEKKTGYTGAVDWWSLGVVAYEFLYGRRPFAGKAQELIQNIQRAEITFFETVGGALPPSQLPPPSSRPAGGAGPGAGGADVIGTPLSAEAIDALRLLLHRDPTIRLSCLPNTRNYYRNHAWFAGMDWASMENKGGQPPFVPDGGKVNFDATYELEEMLLEDNPLRSRPRKRKNTTLTPEQLPSLIELESKFMDFNVNKPRPAIIIDPINSVAPSETVSFESVEMIRDTSSEMHISLADSDIGHHHRLGGGGGAGAGGGSHGSSSSFQQHSIPLMAMSPGSSPATGPASPPSPFPPASSSSSHHHYSHSHSQHHHIAGGPITSTAPAQLLPRSSGNFAEAASPSEGAPPAGAAPGDGGDPTSGDDVVDGIMDDRSASEFTDSCYSNSSSYDSSLDQLAAEIGASISASTAYATGRYDNAMEAERRSATSPTSPADSGPSAEGQAPYGAAKLSVGAGAAGGAASAPPHRVCSSDPEQPDL